MSPAVAPGSRGPATSRTVAEGRPTGPYRMIGSEMSRQVDLIRPGDRAALDLEPQEHAALQRAQFGLLQLTEVDHADLGAGGELHGAQLRVVVADVVADAPVV